jgi:predicted membrane protein
METKNYHSKGKLWLGLAAIIGGAIALYSNIGLNLELKPIIVSWQALLIILGLCKLIYRNYFHGLLLIIVGKFFLMPKLYAVFPEKFSWVGENFVQIYYPILIITGGILLVLYWLLPEKYKHRHCCGHHHFHPEFKVEFAKEFKKEHSKHEFGKNFNRNSGKINKNAIFAGSDEIYLDEVFTGGEISAIFGGINLDLRRATLPEGETFLEINAIFGGVNIYVPNTWLVETRTTTILGGFTDSRLIDNEKIDNSRKLIITGSFIFGGGEMK